MDDKRIKFKQELICDCFPDPKAAADTQKADEGSGKDPDEDPGKNPDKNPGKTGKTGKNPSKAVVVVAAEVHAEPTGEETGEQDYLLEDINEEEEEEEDKNEEEEEEEDLQNPDFDAMIEEGVKAGQL